MTQTALVPLPLSIPALIIPIYVDTSFMMVGAIGRKLHHAKKWASQPNVGFQARGPFDFSACFLCKFISLALYCDTKCFAFEFG